MLLVHGHERSHYLAMLRPREVISLWAFAAVHHNHLSVIIMLEGSSGGERATRIKNEVSIYAFAASVTALLL